MKKLNALSLEILHHERATKKANHYLKIQKKFIELIQTGGLMIPLEFMEPIVREMTTPMQLRVKIR
jgi:hypothetical protein